MRAASYEELLKRNAELERENAELKRENAELKAENTMLCERLKDLELKVANLLNQSSRTSHQAPSKDQKRYPKLRGESKRKQGGQKGHKGHTLELVNDPDEVLYCRVEQEQCSCGYALKDVRGVPGERAQVFDLPQVRLDSKLPSTFGKSRCAQSVGGCIGGTTHRESRVARVMERGTRGYRVT